VASSRKETVGREGVLSDGEVFPLIVSAERTSKPTYMKS